MKKNFTILVIIFSVVLNILFIGSYFYHKLDQYSLTGHQEDHNRFLYEELNLNREQFDRFVPIRDNFHAFVNEQGRKIKARQLELVELLKKDDPAREAVDVKQKEIQTLQREMQAKVIDHLLEESRIFTPEQRRKFFALIKGRIEKSDGPRPRWMPRAKVSTSKEKRP